MLNISDIETSLQLAKAGHADLIANSHLIDMLEELLRRMRPQEDCVQDAAKLFGKRLLFFRTQAGLTRKELAEKAKVSESGIQRYERGDRVAGLKIQQKLAATLDIPITAFHVKPVETKTWTVCINGPWNTTLQVVLKTDAAETIEHLNEIFKESFHEKSYVECKNQAGSNAEYRKAITDQLTKLCKEQRWEWCMDTPHIIV